jgi:hypothetical protein
MSPATKAQHPGLSLSIWVTGMGDRRTPDRPERSDALTIQVNDAKDNGYADIVAHLYPLEGN